MRKLGLATLCLLTVALFSSLTFAGERGNNRDIEYRQNTQHRYVHRDYRPTYRPAYIDRFRRTEWRTVQRYQPVYTTRHVEPQRHYRPIFIFSVSFR